MAPVTVPMGISQDGNPRVDIETISVAYTWIIACPAVMPRRARDGWPFLLYKVLGNQGLSIAGAFPTSCFVSGLVKANAARSPPVRAFVRCGERPVRVLRKHI